ncbi:MAG: alpha/beta hydrolase [Pseudomonadota bacterium]
MTALPLVLVHGFMGGSEQWTMQLKLLGSKRELITPNLPGFSKNSHLEAPETISGFANFVLSELSAQGKEKFMLLGHSMGGMIVQEMVALAPERIERLVLYGTAATGNLPGRFESFETSRQRVQQDGVEVSAKRISATWFHNYEEAEEYENCAGIAVSSSLQAMLASLNAMETWSRAENLESIHCPTLIVWGEADRTYRWTQIEELWKSIPNAQLSVLPGCSHAAHMEKPILFNAILCDFLDLQ